jgi:hypothetical protein
MLDSAASQLPLSFLRQSTYNQYHGQKLRCPPKGNNSDSCSRYIRQGAQYITSYSRLGQIPKRSSATIQSTSQTQLLPRVTVSSLPTTVLPAQSPTLVYMQEILPSLQPRCSGEVPFFFPLSIPNIEFLDHIPHSKTGNQQCYGSHKFSTLHSDSGFMDDSSSASLNSPSREPPQQPVFISEYKSQLFNFNLKLSKRLQYCHTMLRKCNYNYEITDMAHSNSLLATNNNINAPEEIPDSKLFGHVLNDTSEFLNIVQSYSFESNNESAETTSSSSRRTSQNSSPHVGIVLILNLLSAYLQIVEIYDKLFLSLSKQIFKATMDPVHELQILPGLQLAGFSVQQGNLQIKILIQTILHQFDMIERLLGLPTEFRVTEKQDVYLGIFEDDISKGMLKAISSPKSRPISLSNQDGLPALTSLQHMINRIQTFLDT